MNDAKLTVQIYRNIETADTLNDTVIQCEQDDDADDDDCVLLSTLYEWQCYFKRNKNFALAQNNSELLVDVAKWQEKLENKKLASRSKA